MAEFGSWRSYWNFEGAVRTRTRYIYDSDVKIFLDAVLTYSVLSLMPMRKEISTVSPQWHWG